MLWPDLVHTWYDDRYDWTQYFVTSQSELDLDSKPQECEKTTLLALDILQSFPSICMEFGILLRLVGLIMRLILTLSRSNICQPTCFRHGLLLDTTKFCGMIAVSMTLTFTQGHRTGKLELLPSFCCKVARINPNVHDGWLYQEDDFKKIFKYGAYESFVHFLFMYASACIWTLTNRFLLNLSWI